MPDSLSLAGISAALTAVILVTAAALTPYEFGAGPPVPSTPAAADTVDTRPLRLLMVELGQDMNRISDGLWHEDYDMIRRAGRAIADHPKISPEQIQSIRGALEDRFEQFVAYDRVVHDAADRLSSAAASRDLSGILEHRVQLTNGCIGCHTTFRDEVRSALY